MSQEFYSVQSTNYHSMEDSSAQVKKSISEGGEQRREQLYDDPLMEQARRIRMQELSEELEIGRAHV